ncbi:NUDIX hydrolase [Oceanithermus sp.]
MLVPLTATGELLLTLRNLQLASHAGQISFPGGRMEPGENPEEAALREAWEEVRLPPASVTILGRLPQILSPYGYHVTPVLAWLEQKPRLSANPAEVSEIIWVPLEELAHASAWSEERQVGGLRRRVWHYPWRDLDVWGLTANVIHDLLEKLCS